MEYLISILYLISCLCMLAYIKQHRDELLISFYMSNDESPQLKEANKKEKEKMVLLQLFVMVLFSPIVWLLLISKQS